MKTFKPTIILILIAMIVPELLSGSTSLSGFFDIFMFIVLFLGYGIAVLLIREFSVRNNLSYGGIFVLGFAYAILNEGLLSKTMILSSKLPISQFNNYGYFLGINFPWSASIMLWHAVCSVLFPILAVHTLFHLESKHPWLSKKVAIIFSLIVLVFGILIFLGDSKVKGTLGQLAMLLVIMSGIIALAKKIGNKNSPTQPVRSLNAKPVWLGLSTVLFFFVVL